MTHEKTSDEYLKDAEHLDGIAEEMFLIGAVESAIEAKSTAGRFRQYAKSAPAHNARIDRNAMTTHGDDDSSDGGSDAL